MSAEILGDDRQVAEGFARRQAEQLAPGPGTQRPVTAVVAPGRDLPVAREAAEVVEAHYVDQLEAPGASARSTSA